MGEIELEQAVIEKHAIPWFDHNQDRETVTLRNDGRTEGLRETFTVIKLKYITEGDMLKAIMQVFKQEEKDEKTTWLIPRNQVKSMKTRDPESQLTQ